MACEHKEIRCTNGVFFCLLCGAELPPKGQVEEEHREEEQTAETPKKPVKRRGKKGE